MSYCYRAGVACQCDGHLLCHGLEEEDASSDPYRWLAVSVTLLGPLILACLLVSEMLIMQKAFKICMYMGGTKRACPHAFDSHVRCK